MLKAKSNNNGQPEVARVRTGLLHCVKKPAKRKKLAGLQLCSQPKQGEEAVVRLLLQASLACCPWISHCRSMYEGLTGRLAVGPLIALCYCLACKDPSDYVLH